MGSSTPSFFNGVDHQQTKGTLVPSGPVQVSTGRSEFGAWTEHALTWASSGNCAEERGEYEAAIDELLEIIRRKKDWNDGAAREQLIKIFDALGPTHELTTTGRRRLSSVLFS